MRGRAAPPHPKIYRVPPPPRPGWKPPSNTWPKGVATGNIKFHFPAFLPGGGRGEIESLLPGGALPYITYTGSDFEAPDLERGIHFRSVF